MLAGLAADIFAEPRVQLRLERVESDACTRFHADFVSFRLLTTLCGPGTEWRAAPDGPVHRLATGEVAVLKGCLLMPEPRILHRSPPIARTGGVRLVLSLDPPDPLAIRHDTG